MKQSYIKVRGYSQHVPPLTRQIGLLHLPGKQQYSSHALLPASQPALDSLAPSPAGGTFQAGTLDAMLAPDCQPPATLDPTLMYTEVR